jgi:hypothetical protein
MSRFPKAEIIEDKPLVVGVRKAKALLDCSHDQIYVLLREGELKSYLEHNRRKILMSSIESLVERRLAATGGGEFRLCEKPNQPRRRKIAA